MADNYLITGYWGEPHVTAENDRGINAAMFGTGRFVLPVGEQFKAEYIGNNTIRMYDGKLMDNGAAAGIPVGEYVDLLIANAGQGMKRNDLIVFQYKQDASTLVESGTFVVIQGTETSGTASDPALTQGDLLSGKATFEQMALWRVSVSGTTISAPVQLFYVRKDNVYQNEAILVAGAKNETQYRLAVTTAGNLRVDKSTDGGVTWEQHYFAPKGTAAGATALPNDGGTFGADSVAYKSPSRAGSVSLRNGSAVSDGAGIWLYGNDTSNGGRFRLQVYDEDAGVYRQLDGCPDGSLMWDKGYVNPPFKEGVEYLTTERYGGAEVYAKRIDYTNTADIGSTNGVSEVAIPHGITGLYRILRCDATKGTSVVFPYIHTNGGMTAVRGVSSTEILLRTENTVWTANESVWHFTLYYTKE